LNVLGPPEADDNHVIDMENTTGMETILSRCNAAAPKTFFVELIKPSHYDDDGYVIQWWRGFVPSNSLSTIYGLAQSSRRQRILGRNVEIEIGVYDETTTAIPIKRIIRRFRRNGNQGLICLVGVQTNQFARALDLARQFRAQGISVMIGGFHVSGCSAMLPEATPELKEALALGITLFAGEAEGHFDELLRAAHEHRLEPVYNFMNDLPSLEGQALPTLPSSQAKRYLSGTGCFDAGRGCPFNCSFCTIINVQGRKSRFRSADDIEQIIRSGYGQGICNYFITDDDFARNRNWEPILDRIIQLKNDARFKIHLTLQVDAASYKIPHFVAKAARAGCRRVFIGLESINPESLKGASKGQNKITEYRAMLQAWRKVKVFTFAGYILGFPGDTPESIERDIQIIQKELPIDLLEFFVLTPLPGSRDHQALYLNGTPMDADVNRYDAEHVTTAHPQMTRAQWQTIYDRAWHQYYSPKHIETLLRRAGVSGPRPSRLASMIFYFYASYSIEGVHPLQGGFLRRKSRKQRRVGMMIENALTFHLRRLRQLAWSLCSALRLRLKIERIRRRVANESASATYMDAALSPPLSDYSETLEMYEATESARQTVARVRKRAASASSPSLSATSQA
jgi:Radical SAM superfamily